MNEAAAIDHPKTGTAIAESPTRMPTIGEELKAKQSNFEAALPAHIPAARFSRVVMTAVQRNPDLLKADRRSLWNAAMQAAQDGLLPDGREGAFVVFKSVVQWMPMFAGIRKKVRNSGEIRDWNCQVVYAKDTFEWALGDDPFITHKPWTGEGDAGPIIAAYSIAVFKTGERSREVMTRAQIDKVRAVSRAKDSGPWVSWYSEMARKTVGRRHAKFLPMSTDMDDLIRRDDALYDLASASDKAHPIIKGNLAERLDALADGGRGSEDLNHDPETGEIVPDKQLHEDPADSAAATDGGVSPQSAPSVHSSSPATQEQAGDGKPVAAGRVAASKSAGTAGNESAPAQLPDLKAASEAGLAECRHYLAAHPDAEKTLGRTAIEVAMSAAEAIDGKRSADTRRAAILADLSRTGDAKAAEGREALDGFLDDLTGDEQAMLTHATVKAWRDTAAKVAAQ